MASPSFRVLTVLSKLTQLIQFVNQQNRQKSPRSVIQTGAAGRVGRDILTRSPRRSAALGSLFAPRIFPQKTLSLRYRLPRRLRHDRDLLRLRRRFCRWFRGGRRRRRLRGRGRRGRHGRRLRRRFKIAENAGVVPAVRRVVELDHGQRLVDLRHDPPPDLRGGVAGIVHGRGGVVAGPDGGHIVRREAAEPAVVVIGGRAGLAGDGHFPVAEIDLVARAVPRGGLEHFGHAPGGVHAEHMARAHAVFQNGIAV